MPDKYARWNAWAPRFIADLINDFGLTDWQAAGFVGNFAAESAYFNDIVEDGALAKGWAGGTGFAQWTAARRKTFEAWIRRKGWAADSYEGNYSYLYRELKGLEPGLNYARVVDMVKEATGIENAAWRVAKYFEAPAVINLGPRAKAAAEALALYRAKPVPPTKWTTDITTPAPAEVTMPPTPTTNVIVTDSKPALPWYRSGVFTGTGAASGFGIFTLLGLWNPAGGIFGQSPEFYTTLVGTAGAMFALVQRLISNAQPITATQAGADQIAAQKTLNGVASSAAIAQQQMQPMMPQPIYGTQPVYGTQPIQSTMQGPPVTQVPLENLPLNQLAQEIPRVLELVGTFVPQLAALGQIARAVSNAATDPHRGPQPPVR